MKWTSKPLALVLAVFLLFGLLPTAAAEGSAQVVVLQLGNNCMTVDSSLQPVDPQSEQVYPIAENNRTLVPVSRIVAAFGGTSTWDPATNDTTFSLNGHTVTHRIGTKAVNIDNRTVTIMSVASRAINNRTYVPLRTVLEGLGLTVNYEPANRLVVVSQGAVDETALDQLPGSQILLGAWNPPAGANTVYSDVRITYLDKEDGGYWVAPGEHACNLFDGDLNTEWRAYCELFSSRGIVGGSQLHCIFSLSKPVSITGYTMGLGQAQWNDDSAALPSDWVLYGANCDGEPGGVDWDGWEKIDCVYGDESMVAGYQSEYRFELDKPVPEYQHYRLELQGNHYSKYIALGEFSLTFQGDPAVLDLPDEYYASGWPYERQTGGSSSSSDNPSSGSGVCSICHGMKKTLCTVCNGKGYISYATGVPGANNIMRKPCPSIRCSNGWATCAGCGGTGKS